MPVCYDAYHIRAVGLICLKNLLSIRILAGKHNDNGNQGWTVRPTPLICEADTLLLENFMTDLTFARTQEITDEALYVEFQNKSTLDLEGS